MRVSNQCYLPFSCLVSGRFQFRMHSELEQVWPHKGLGVCPPAGGLGFNLGEYHRKGVSIWKPRIIFVGGATF